MTGEVRARATVRVIAPLLVVLLLAPGLSGCLAAYREERVPKAVLTRCAGAAYTLAPTPLPAAFPRERPAGGLPPPLQGTVRIVLLVPPRENETGRGAALAAAELKAGGAPLVVETRVVADRGAAAGLEAFRAAMGAPGSVPPSAVVSALGDDETDAMVDEAHRRRVALLATNATATRLTQAHEGTGFVFRVPPPAAHEGRALADLLWSAGCRTANVIAADDERSRDVRVAFREAFEDKGGSVSAVVRAANATDAVRKTEFLAKAGIDEPRPDALVVIAPPETSADVLRVAYDRKVTARTVLFFSESAKAPGFLARAGDDERGGPLAENLRGTAAMRVATRSTDAVSTSYAAANAGRAPGNESLRAYDATYLVALAAYCARAPDAAAVAAKLPVVANRDTGDTDVSGANPQAALSVASGCFANYVGASHDYDWTARGDVATGRFFVWTVASGGFLDAVTRYEPAGLVPP